MTSIYDKINDIDFDTDSIELNDIEKEKMFRSAKLLYEILKVK